MCTLDPTTPKTPSSSSTVSIRSRDPLVPRIPLIEELTTEPVPPGYSLLVEYDPTSLWYSASYTIAAAWLRQGGIVRYGIAARPPDKMRSYLKRLGVDSLELEGKGQLDLYDFFTSTLGHKSKEKYAPPSLKVPDLSIWWTQAQLGGPGVTNLLRMFDDLSVLDRFNEEKSWVEFTLTRMIPTAFFLKEYAIRGVMMGVHSDWVYKRLEAAHDGVIDFRLDESGEEPRSLMRIRSMRDLGFDGRWHSLRPGENFEVTLDK